MEPTSATIHHHANANATAASAMGAGIRWNSPIPYLFGGMAIVLMLIATALLILACTSDKHSDDKEKDGAGKSSKVVDDGPKFVVIMAGAHKPTFLAKPMPKPKPEPEPIVGLPNSSSTTTSICSPNGDEEV